MSTALVIALPEESKGIEGYPIYLSGCGKVNATIATMRAIRDGHNFIINFGSAGSVSDVTGLVEVTGYVDRDMDNGTILGNLYWTNGNGIAYIITELAKYTNHSQNPNVRASLHGDRLYCRAIRPIGKGEEVLMDYDQFQALGIHNIEQSQPHWNTNPSNTVE